jgi:hypothetical protein
MGTALEYVRLGHQPFPLGAIADCRTSGLRPHPGTTTPTSPTKRERT